MILHPPDLGIPEGPGTEIGGYEAPTAFIGMVFGANTSVCKALGPSGKYYNFLDTPACYHLGVRARPLSTPAPPKV